MNYYAVTLQIEIKEYPMILPFNFGYKSEGFINGNDAMQVGKELFLERCTDFYREDIHRVEIVWFHKFQSQEEYDAYILSEI